MKSIKRLPHLIAVLIFALVSAGTAAMPAFAADSTVGASVYFVKAGWCLSTKVPVAPAGGQPRTWEVAVAYCQPFKWAKNTHQVDVLTHGATYTNTYWNWPVDPELYSYVDKTLADGRATLNYDRIGNGSSTRPLSTEINMTTDAYVLHQLVQWLRLVGFSQINSVSHSYGSGVAIAEAATYQDVSRVIVTGYLHRPSNPAVTAGNYPANQDPKFVNAGLDGGYLTTRPGVRLTSFHSPSSDPAVVAYDEQQKDVVSLTGLLNFLGQRAVPAGSNLSNSIHVPVLSVVGQQDAIFCYDQASFDCTNTATVRANEAPYYAAAAQFDVVTIGNSGHSLALHPTANDSYAAISNWIKNN